MINAELKSVSYLGLYVGLKIAFSNTSHAKKLETPANKKARHKIVSGFSIHTLN
jgi:hypothetical protein